MDPQTTQTLRPDTETSSEIERHEQEFVRHVNDGRYDRLVQDFYTEDARFFPPNAPAVEGRQAIRALFERMGQAYSDIRLHNGEIVASGDLAVAHGTYTARMKGDEGMMQDRGKYVEAWRRANGRWQCFLDTFTSDLEH